MLTLKLIGWFYRIVLSSKLKLVLETSYQVVSCQTSNTNLPSSQFVKTVKTTSRWSVHSSRVVNKIMNTENAPKRNSEVI